MSTSRIVDGIEYGPVTFVRNADGTLERIKEELQVQIALDGEAAMDALAAKQELWRLCNAKQRQEALKRKAERAAKAAVQA